MKVNREIIKDPLPLRHFFYACYKILLDESCGDGNGLEKAFLYEISIMSLFLSTDITESIVGLSDCATDEKTLKEAKKNWLKNKIYKDLRALVKKTNTIQRSGIGSLLKSLSEVLEIIRNELDLDENKIKRIEDNVLTAMQMSKCPQEYKNNIH